MPKLDLASIPHIARTGYPGDLARKVDGRTRQSLGDAGGLTQFEVNLMYLQPGAQSSIRHWHENEDEFAIMLSGELVLIEEGAETIMKAGDCATFKAGVANGHTFVNRSDAQATFLVIGTRAATERCHYPDVDLAYVLDSAGPRFTHKDGSRF